MQIKKRTSNKWLNIIGQEHKRNQCQSISYNYQLMGGGTFHWEKVKRKIIKKKLK
jgi:hypothetical protein